MSTWSSLRTHWPHRPHRLLPEAKVIASGAEECKTVMADQLRQHHVERSGAIPEVFRVTSQAFHDARGWQFEALRGGDLESWGVRVHPEDARNPFVQTNVSISHPWALRGLHYQVPWPQGKFVRCVKGAIFDVALDLRQSSPTFGCHASFPLLGLQAMWIPPGFAHGFMAGPEGATVVYMFTDYHDAASERAIDPFDPQLAIPWPLPTGILPILSDRDRNALPFVAAEVYP